MGEFGATCEDAAALETVLTEGPRTQDIGGRTSTREVGKAIAEAV
jgi:tartrate dehydrogenase/decarboxylase/D-malate dehydrogenase